MGLHPIHIPNTSQNRIQNTPQKWDWHKKYTQNIILNAYQIGKPNNKNPESIQ